jgi:hypothetical protein
MEWTDKGYLEKIKDKERYGIFLDMGVGKTSLLLALIDYKMFAEDVKKVLIITPKDVSLSTWQNEISKWENFKYLKKGLRLINGDEEKRIKLYKETREYTIDIISSSLVTWMYGEKKLIKQRNVLVRNEHTPEYDLIIVDECSQFKNVSSQRYKALKEISKGKKLFLLSGTQFSNVIKDKHGYTNTDELYYILYLLNVYKGSLTQYRNDFEFTLSWEQYKYRMKEEVYKMLIEKIHEVSITEKLSLNIKINHKKVYCELDRERFNTLKREYYIETGGYQKITVSNQAIMLNKALQLSNGFTYDETGLAHRINNHKIDMLKFFIENVKDNVIVFYIYGEDRQRILKEIPNVKEYTPENEELWNQGKIKVLLLSPFASKYGLNLQYGGHTIAWFGLIWSAESYVQANARLYRTGQTQDVDVYYFMSHKSFDDYVFDRLVLKVNEIDDFKNYL